MALNATAIVERAKILSGSFHTVALEYAEVLKQLIEQVEDISAELTVWKAGQKDVVQKSRELERELSSYNVKPLIFVCASLSLNPV